MTDTVIPIQMPTPAQPPAAVAASQPAVAPVGGTEVEFGQPVQKPQIPVAAKPSLGRGLDIGTMFVVGAKDVGGTVQFTSVRDAFFALDYNDLLVEMMQSVGVDYVKRGNEIVVIGDKSIEFANTFRAELRRPLQDGVISPKEKDAFGIIELILEKAVGRAAEPGETCCFSVPAEAIDKEGSSVVFHQGMFARFVESFGYAPKPLNEGEAIAYSELVGDKLTGMSLSFGAGMVNACFMMLGVPYLKFAVARSGDWIDRQAASASNSTIASITALKESGSVDISNPAGWEQSAIAMYYKTLIRYVCVNLHKQVTQEARLPQLKDPIKVVISGGTSRIRGFKQAFEGELKSLEWPFVVSDVVTASDPMNAVANGCLVAAKLAEKNRKA